MDATTKFFGGGFWTLFLVLLVLKLVGAIDWSWWWVTAPLWGPPALVLAIGVPIVFVVVAMKALRQR